MTNPKSILILDERSHSNKYLQILYNGECKMQTWFKSGLALSHCAVYENEKLKHNYCGKGRNKIMSQEKALTVNI